MSCLGIWVWSKLATFGDQPQCTPETSTVLFGHDIPVTNKPLYIASIVVYSITALPGINLILLIAFVILVLMLVLSLLEITVLLNKTLRHKDHSPFARRLAFVGGPLVGAFLVLLFVIDTELMIARNKRLVMEGESQWTFGQTLAMLMVVLPLVEVSKQGFNWYRGGRREDEAYFNNRGIKSPVEIQNASELLPLTA